MCRRVASQELDARRSSLAEKLARKQRRRDKRRRKLRDAGDAEPDGAYAGRGFTLTVLYTYTLTDFRFVFKIHKKKAWLVLTVLI